MQPKPVVECIQPLVLLHVVSNGPTGEVLDAGVKGCFCSQLFTSTAPKSFAVGFCMNTLAPV